MYNVFIFHKTRFALEVKINNTSKLSNSLHPRYTLKRKWPSLWSINKLITANDSIGDNCCRIEGIAGLRIETITGHPFKCLGGGCFCDKILIAESQSFVWYSSKYMER